MSQSILRYDPEHGDSCHVGQLDQGAQHPGQGQVHHEGDHHVDHEEHDQDQHAVGARGETHQILEGELFSTWVIW